LHLGCQCFVAIPPELHAKGGPRRFEAIFVGYEENQLGWHVRDLHGKYHFSCDVIFNELVPGRLSSSSSCLCSTPSSSSSILPPYSIPSRPSRILTHTAKDQAFADAIQLRDNRLATQRANSLHLQQSLSAISDFVSLFATDDLLLNGFTDDLNSLEHDVFVSFCLLTSVDHLRFQCPLNFDLCKALESYHEVLAHLDEDVWCSAMRRELDSLEEHKAFERTTLPSDCKAIGLRWCYTYKFNPDGLIIKGKEKAHLCKQSLGCTKNHPSQKAE